MASFLGAPLGRSLTGVKLIIADGHTGLKAAGRATFPSVLWQHCSFHLQQNAGTFFTQQKARRTVAVQMRAVLNTPDRAKPERLLRATPEVWRKEHPKLAERVDEACSERLTVFDFPAEHRIRLRITKGPERIDRKLCQRFRMASISLSPDSRLRQSYAFVLN